jgi:hypothetical protein
MRRLLGVGLACTIAAAAAGCERPPDREFASLESALALRVVRITRDGPDGQSTFALELRNGGPVRSRACLGPGRRIGSRSTWSHHPGCVRQFELSPGGVFAWSETHAVSEFERIENAVEVEIVNPRRCSSAGCAGFWVASAPAATAP